jgi:hypothetical protein
MRQSAKVFSLVGAPERIRCERKKMKLTTKTLRRAIGGAALAAILATEAPAQSSWPTPPAPQTENPTPQSDNPTPQAESAPPQGESAAAPQSEPASQLSPGRLMQMLAPIALYPDDLLADILMAATYPLDVVEAARWLQDPQNAGLKGDQLFAALQEKPWDPSVKSLTPFPQILRMLDANLEWTEELGESYLADPAGVMDSIQTLRRRAQLAQRLVMTPQLVVSQQQNPTSAEEPIAIEPSSPGLLYVPICDPSFVYGSWPYPDYPPFFPVVIGATIGGCSWISGPIIAPFFGLAILNFRARHIDIDRERRARFDRERYQEKDRDSALVEEWRHDPGHRGNVPYRNPAVSAMFGRGTPAANVTPGLGERWTGPPRLEGPRPVSLPQAWRPPATGDARPAPNFVRRWPEEIRTPPEGGQSPGTGVQSRFQGAQPSLEGVDPNGDGTPAGRALDHDMGTGMQIERGLAAPVPPALGGLRGSPSFGGMGPTRFLGGRRSFRPLVGAGAHPFGGGAWQAPSGGMGAGMGRPGH